MLGNYGKHMKILTILLASLLPLSTILNYGNFLSLWRTHYGSPYGQDNRLAHLIMGVLIVVLIILIPEKRSEGLLM